MVYAEFKADGHRITKELYRYVETLLEIHLTLKKVAEITGLNKNTVKAIDNKRLEDKYTYFDGKNRRIKKPDGQANFLSIDEFKLHKGQRYATHIIDLETGHILWLAYGKKKQVVYDFIDHVGMEWMKGVKAVSCDMNSDFQLAFKERCPHLRIVFDHFHLVKNFNDYVVTNVRKDEQKKLIESGDIDGARLLKKSKYILTSSRKTLERKDNEAIEGKAIEKGNELFGKEEIKRKFGYIERYKELLKLNKLFFTIDVIKEKISLSYGYKNEDEMRSEIESIIKICDDTGNRHFKRFSNLLRNHIDGIIAHATYKLTSGKIEGINNKIKTLRRQGYGYPDDRYFFLKLFDLSRSPRG